MNGSHFKSAWVAMAMFMACSSHASLLETGQTTIQVRGQSLAVELVHQEQWMSPTLEEAVIHIAPVLRSHAAKTNTEACVRLCTSMSEPSQWEAVVITAHSQVACPLIRVCSQGFEPTEHHIHSHPRQQVSRLNRADQILTGSDESVGHDRNIHLPSRADQAIGPGFLVTQRSIMWFDHRSHRVVHRF